MAEEEQKSSSHTTRMSANSTFPIARVKKIIKIDKDITRVSSEALFLISRATEQFLQFLVEISSDIAAEKKRKIVKTDHLRIAVKRHQPTRDFLLDSLPQPEAADVLVDKVVKKGKWKEKAVPANTRRIDSFFKKPAVVDEEEDDEVPEDCVEDEEIPEFPDRGEDDVIVVEEVEDRGEDDVIHVEEEVEERAEDDVIVEEDEEVPDRVEEDVILVEEEGDE